MFLARSWYNKHIDVERLGYYVAITALGYGYFRVRVPGGR